MIPEEEVNSGGYTETRSTFLTCLLQSTASYLTIRYLDHYLKVKDLLLLKL